MKNTNQKLTNQDLWAIYRKQFLIRSCLNFERYQNVGFTAAMKPIIDKYYDTDEEKKEIIDRHMQLFLTQPMVASLPIGVAAALEEKIATEGDIDPSAVNSVKTALMGPLAALGDSLINGTARPIVAGIACSLALNGSILGPILFLIVMSIITLGVRYLGVFKGYKEGTEAVIKLQQSGLMSKITELASVAAFVVVGGFIPGNVTLNVPWSFTSGDVTISIQETLNNLLPGLLPVCLTLLMYVLIKKKVASPVALMMGLLVVGTVLSLVGIL